MDIDLLGVIDNCKEGDLQSFKELFLHFKDKAYRIAYLITRDHGLSEDAVQEAFIKVYSQIDNLKDPKAFHTWFYRIVVNTTLDLLKYNNDIPTDNIMIISNDDNNPETASLQNEKRDRILEAIYSLKPMYRVVIILRYYQELKIKEISRILDIPAGTVKSRLYKAKSLLKRAIKDDPCTMIKYKKEVGCNDK